jgi:hypothetical protein
MLSFKQFIAEGLTGYKKNPIYKFAKQIDKSKSDNFQTRTKQFVNKLTKAGYTPSVIGGGSYGSVFEHPSNPNEVVKIFHGDPEYEEFAKYARDNHENDPHLPKIQAVHKLSPTLGYVRMEKLFKIPVDHPVKSMMSNLPYEAGLSDIIKPTPDNLNADGKPREKWPDGSFVMTPEHNWEPYRQNLQKNYPGFYNSLTNLANHFSETNPQHDFKTPGNMMQRDDGTPVISDPINTFKQQWKKNVKL